MLSWFLFLDEYSKLDGQWKYNGIDGQRYSRVHSTLLKAKQHCSHRGKCFGLMVDSNSGSVRSINFPIRLSNGYYVNDWYIHKKENSFGNIVYDDCLFSLNEKIYTKEVMI